MIEVLKKRLLEDPEKIKQLLEKFDFYKIRIHSSYISFARSQESSPKSITIYLDSNEALLVKDWATNEVKDVFNYIISNRSVSFKEVISETKNILGIDGYVYNETPRVEAFGGFYGRIKNRTKPELKVYDESILDKYIMCCNQRFLKDNISLETQRKFEIGFDIESQSITIPIRNEVGNLVGVKCRRNEDNCEMKYWYDVPCQMSQLLYGFSDNYNELESADVIYVFEAEKSTMQCYSYGYKSAVSLGSGTISKKQVQLLLSLNPKRIVLLHDAQYPWESVERNLKAIQSYNRMRETELYYWDNFGKDYGGKISPTDKGEQFFEAVLANELKQYKGEQDDKQLCAESEEELY